MHHKKYDYLCSMDDELINIDPEDISDVLLKIEQSFHIKLDKELEHISTFGELCDHIADKVRLEHSEDCTTQQAFYKLRNILRSEGIEIYPDTLLTVSMVRQIERSLGYKLSILRPPHMVTITLTCLLIASFILLFINWQIGLSGIVVCIAGLKLAQVSGKQMDIRTVGEAVQKMAREHYVKARRNPETINRNEIQGLLIDLFSVELGLDKSKLKREARVF